MDLPQGVPRTQMQIFGKKGPGGIGEKGGDLSVAGRGREDSRDRRRREILERPRPRVDERVGDGPVDRPVGSPRASEDPPSPFLRASGSFSVPLPPSKRDNVPRFRPFPVEAPSPPLSPLKSSLSSPPSPLPLGRS
eukprot:scaffold285_cov330-Pavlova_lutheri.AAC.48